MATREERLRLSRDLHDLLGHNLSLIALKSELARRLLGRDPAAAEGEVRDIETVARSSLQEARAAVQGLRSASLSSELDRARKALEAAQIEVEVNAAEALPASVETADPRRRNLGLWTTDHGSAASSVPLPPCARRTQAARALPDGGRAERTPATPRVPLAVRANRRSMGAAFCLRDSAG